MTDAPSNPLTRTLSLTVAASSIAAAIALLSPPCSAQQSPAAASTQDSGVSGSPAATHNAASPGFQSQGIKATITSISLSPGSQGTITLQFMIQNTRQSGVYLALVGGYGGSAGTLMATNGGVYKMDYRNISGMSFCNDGTTRRTDDQVQTCLSGSDEHNMAMIDAGQSGILGIIYQLDPQSHPATQNDNVNFALKFIARSAPGQAGTLSAAAGGKAGPASVVTISFPLVPLASP
jgi:hypothetical protein